MPPTKSKQHQLNQESYDEVSEVVDLKTGADRLIPFDSVSNEKFLKSVKSTDRNDQLGENISFGKRRQWFSHSKCKKDRINVDSNETKNKTFTEKKKPAFAFRYGNYHQYYGYRNPGQMDSRMQCMKREWFAGKDVLDIGCNAGHFTLALAKDFSPKSVVGIDIDHELVKMSMRNVRHYVTAENVSEVNFPMSLVLSYGPVAQMLDPKGRYDNSNFPFNVQFIQGNYILPTDELVEEQEEYFDTILCLSLTKWIHLNWGDTGIKRLFRRIYKQLRPNGFLVLEAQTYQSYARKKKITAEVFKNYNAIQLFPEMFNEYLLKEIGFECCELIDIPAHSSQGFSRPIYLFTKGGDPKAEKMPKHIIYCDSSDDQQNDSDVEQFSD